MTNAELLAKIKAEIERRFREYNKDSNHHLQAAEDAELLSFLDTLEESEKPNNQMEIVNDLTSEVPTRAVQLPDGRWVTEAFANNNCIYGRKPEERHCEYCSANCSTGHDFQRTKGLDEAANEYSNEHNDDCFDAIGSVCPHIIDAFIAGAKWQAEHSPLPEDTVLFNKGVEEGKRLMMEEFEGNRLAACDSQTKEEYDRETDFVDSIIKKEHRQPTFSDAINYGMRLQKEKMTEESLEGKIFEENYGPHRKVISEWTREEIGNQGDKVRVIVCKKED